MSRLASVEDLIEPLRHATLFSCYSETELQEVSHFSHAVSLRAEEVLFRESEPCRAIYCVVDGLMKLSVEVPDHHAKTVELIESGQTFAEAAMFSGQGYPVTASAVDDSRLVAVDAYTLMRYLRQHPELTWQMLAVMSRRLHQLVGQIKTVALHNAEQKVATYLLDHFDPDEPERSVSHLPNRRSDLASVIGLTTETLCRVVASFRRRGWITTTDSAIFIQAPGALQDLLSQPRR